MIRSLEDDSWWTNDGWRQVDDAWWANEGGERQTWAAEAVAWPTLDSEHPPQTGNTVPTATSTISNPKQSRAVTSRKLSGWQFHSTHQRNGDFHNSWKRGFSADILSRPLKTVSWATTVILDFANAPLRGVSNGPRRLLDLGAT